MRLAIIVTLISLFLFGDSNATAQTTVLREGAEQLLQATAKFFGKAGAHEIGEQLAEYGGETFVRNLAQRLVREGGEEALEKVVVLSTKYGPDVLRAVDNAPSPTTLLHALDDIPTDQVGPAIKRLSAGSQGKTLANLVERHGANVGIDKDGNAQVVSKPGLLGRTVETTVTNILRPILYVLLPLIALGASAWIAIKLWSTYRLNRLKLTHAEHTATLKHGLTTRSTGAAKSADLPIENQSSPPGDR